MVREQRRWSLMAVVCLWVFGLSAPAWAVDVQSRLQQMIRAADLRQTKVAVFVADADTGQVYAQINSDEPMIPASNMKLLTTTAALDVLGPDFMFRTTLGQLPPARQGEAPNLVVQGDGDPAFGDPVLLDEHGYVVDNLLDQWVQVIANTGQTRFANLIVDDRVFDRQFVHESWPEGQLHLSYCAQVSGLNFYENCVDVLLIPSSQRGQAPSAQLFPFTNLIKTTNKATTGKTDAYWVSRDLGTNHLTFRGSVRNRPYGPIQVTVHDPATYFGYVLVDRLKTKGITVDNVITPAEDQVLPQPQPLHVVQTALPLVLNRVNRDSQNLFAESLLKRMGRAVTGNPGSWENGPAAVRLALRDRIGADAAALTIADGSGMSRENRVTARLLAQLLRTIHTDADAGKRDAFLKSLAHAGEDGTLRKRLKQLNGDVLGKSGYLREVSALSGYLILPPAHAGAPQRTIVFSFLFNGYRPPLYNQQMKKLQDQFVRAIAEAVTPTTTAALNRR